MDLPCPPPCKCNCVPSSSSSRPLCSPLCATRNRHRGISLAAFLVRSGLGRCRARAICSLGAGYRILRRCRCTKTATRPATCGRCQGPRLALALILAPSVHIAQIPGSAFVQKRGRSARGPLTTIVTPRRRPCRKAGARGCATGWPIARSSSSILPLGNTCILLRTSLVAPVTAVKGHLHPPPHSRHDPQQQNHHAPVSPQIVCSVQSGSHCAQPAWLGGSGLPPGLGTLPV
jgi:hypothetical protein